MIDENIMQYVDPQKRCAVKNAYFENGNCIIELEEGWSFQGCDKDGNDICGNDWYRSIVSLPEDDIDNIEHYCRYITPLFCGNCPKCDDVQHVIIRKCDNGKWQCGCYECGYWLAPIYASREEAEEMWCTDNRFWDSVIAMRDKIKVISSL